MNELTKEQLYESTLEKINLPMIHPLHKAMLEECCEKAIVNDHVDSLDTLVIATQIAFLISWSALKGVVFAGLEYADVVNINYRGLQIPFTKDSPILK